MLCLRCLPLADAATKPDASAGQLSVAFHLVTQGRDGEMKVWTLSSTWTAGEWRLQPPSDAATATWAAQTYTFCRFRRVKHVVWRPCLRLASFSRNLDSPPRTCSAAGLPQAGWFAVAPAEEGEAVQVLSIPGCEPVCSLRVAEGKEKHGMVSSLALVPTRAPDAGDASTTGAGATGDALLAGGFESGAVVLWYLQLGRASAPVWAQLATVKVRDKPRLPRRPGESMSMSHVNVTRIFGSIINVNQQSYNFMHPPLAQTCTPSTQRDSPRPRVPSIVSRRCTRSLCSPWRCRTVARTRRICS